MRAAAGRAGTVQRSAASELTTHIWEGGLAPFETGGERGAEADRGAHVTELHHGDTASGGHQALLRTFARAELPRCQSDVTHCREFGDGRGLLYEGRCIGCSGSGSVGLGQSSMWICRPPSGKRGFDGVQGVTAETHTARRKTRACGARGTAGQGAA